MHLHPQRKLCNWEKEGHRYVRSRECPLCPSWRWSRRQRWTLEQPYAPGASSTHSPLHSGSQVTPCLKASLPFPIFLSHTLALPSEVEGRESLVREDKVVRKKAFPAGVSPSPSNLLIPLSLSCCRGLS